MTDRRLDQACLDAARRRIEALSVTAMEALYSEPLRLQGEAFNTDLTLPPAAFPGLKPMERVVCYFDYAATGLSVIAPLAAAGDARAAAVVRTVLDNTRCYVRRIYRRWPTDNAAGRTWDTPLRRLLAHLGLAWPSLERLLPPAELAELRELLTAQVETAIEHNNRFWPGVRGWLFLSCNNHTAIFAQGIWLCGKALNRPDWVALTEDFAERYLEDMHWDGYFDETAQPERLGGPSMVYTPLTAGSLYDILDGHHRRQAAFLKAGRFYRRFLDASYGPIPLADERTNASSRPSIYGVALHTLTAEGRGMVLDLLGCEDYIGQATIEGLAVLHHEIGLMQCGETATPENRIEGDVRITLPLGVLRRGDWTAVLCGLRATNHEFAATSDYALDQQSHVFLAHGRLGILLPGTKGKHNPLLSTCRRGDDAYTIATGELRNGPDGLDVTVHYRTFDVRIAWELEAGRARLRFTSASPDEITTTLPLTPAAEGCLRAAAVPEIVDVPGFSPYTAGNRTDAVRSLVFRWRGRLDLAFEVQA